LVSAAGSSPDSPGLHFGTSWRLEVGWPGQSWLRTIENYLRPVKLGLATVWQQKKWRAQD